MSMLIYFGCRGFERP